MASLKSTAAAARLRRWSRCRMPRPRRAGAAVRHSVARAARAESAVRAGITPPGAASSCACRGAAGACGGSATPICRINERVTFVDHYVTSGADPSASRSVTKYVNIAAGGQPPPPCATGSRRPRIIVPMSGRVVPRGAWSTPPEPRIRRVSTRYASSGNDNYSASRVSRRDGERDRPPPRRGPDALLEANDLTMRSVIRPGTCCVFRAGSLGRHPWLVVPESLS